MLKTSDALATLLEVARDSRRMRSLIFRVETEDFTPQGSTLWGRNPNTFKRVSDTPTLRYAHNPQKSRHCQAKNDFGVSVSVSKTIVLVSGTAYNADAAYAAYTAEGG